ncbi:hypothetical protein NB700_001760 [Xanthomonas sacchari]|uniref:Uncharacterized protein n=1 Tax=Xanthomonas sacchari TaxID=56458 RepID=A0ABT3DUN6_9XANT|nr:hypothetical protein [Xanthomonas sacchari]MCW0399204.1 hypothetical protein [Xanthomonas sacchari]
MMRLAGKRSVWPGLVNFAGLLVLSFFWMIMALLIAKTYSPELWRGLVSIGLVGITVAVSNSIQHLARKASACFVTRREVVQ